MHKQLKIVSLLTIVALLTIDDAFAQIKPASNDSTQLYKDIETYSGRSKFTRFMYHLIFKPVVKVSKKKGPKKKASRRLKQKPYSAFEGKIIRHIIIVTLDPFGYSIADTNSIPQLFLARTGNKLHVKSQHIAIRNLLLIHQNQPFDSLLVKESERLVRGQRYVTDVSFFVTSTSRNSDSVDVAIRELDNWSLIPNGSASTTSMTINLADKNFMGTGHELKNGFTWNHSTGKIAYNTNYHIPNLRNTYVNSTLHYGTDEFGNFTRSLAFDRPFFSPFAKWAAGISFSQQLRKDSIRTNDSQLIYQRFKLNTQEYWAGNAIQLFKGNTENIRTTNFISAARFYRIRYLEKPIEVIDTLQVYSNEDFYLASFGISTRKYVQDKYIFKFGVTEDVPVGKVFGFTAGYQVKNNIGRLFMGGRISIGNYFPYGYLSSNFEYQTFFHASHTEQGIITIGINYFTGLFEVGKWKFRQFIKPQVSLGINRFPSDSLTLNDGPGLDGFNSTSLSGTKRLLFTLQTQSYAPWNFVGFHFGPYLICSVGMLGDEATGFRNSRLYSQFGIGVLVKNENLVINTFQFSLSFYPMIPGIGKDNYKFNSFRTADFGFRDFVIGKPEVLEFR